jgi:Zn-finger nucleic acid-binding protein
MSPDAGALHCPNCGGPAAPGQASCHYCHSVLATVSCPGCFALIFDGAVYCPACGARRTRRVGPEQKIPCPACRANMRDVQLGETAMLECPRCHGIWTDAATFEHICANHEAQAAVLHQGSSDARQAPNREVRYRKCVACGKFMNRLNFGRLSGTVVDVCKGHGTFLDAGELHGIVRFIQQGGLERARKRQIEELKEQEERLRHAQTIQRGGAADLNVDSFSGIDLLSLLDHLRG